MAYTPRDIIRILNGHACGEKDKYPERCQTGDGRNTGECLFGLKQRGYLFDKFRLGEGSSAALITEFKIWIASNMIEALFLQSVCLPPDEYGCPSEKDPVFIQNLKQSKMAIEETLELIQEAEEQCICPCKRLVLQAFDASTITDCSGDAEGWINVGIQVPDSDDKNLLRAIDFDGSKLFEEIGFTYPTVVTQTDIVHLELVEDDTLLCGGDDTFPVASSFNNAADPRWYDKQCDAYTVIYDDIRVDGKNIPFRFDIVGVLPEECRVKRPGVSLFLTRYASGLNHGSFLTIFARVPLRVTVLQHRFASSRSVNPILRYFRVHGKENWWRGL